MTRSILSADNLLPLALLIGSTLLASCSDSAENATGAGGGQAADANYNTTLDMAEIMNSVLEPPSDILWDSAGWIMSDAGYEELYPTTDEGWNYVRQQAAIIVETGNILALPGRALDGDAWMVYSEGLSEAGLLAMRAAESRDEEAFFQAGAQLYSVCTACHQAYDPEINQRYVSAED
ncbi:MAG: hypothetical protein WDZ76_03355 [Pseudohongiellaceae bacterium]